VNREAKIRAFLAVPSDPNWLESAGALVSSVRRSLPEASWTRPESWHLTVKFLGELPSEVVEAFASEMASRAAECAPGELNARGAVVFPPRRPPRVLGVGFADSAGLDEVLRLASEAERVARRVGAERDDRPFHPHVTFARLRRPWLREAVSAYEQAVAAWSFPAWPVRGCVLYASRLTPQGAIHTPLAEWSFAGIAGGVRA
jgi:RNA 2',3'-cyclic 3'-phosphodiesterase